VHKKKAQVNQSLWLYLGGNGGSVFMADFLLMVQPHERDARNDKGLRRVP
jgi:hypothetical protein